MKKCNECKWWHRRGAKYPENIPTWSDTGYCKAHPEHIKRQQDDWCGEFQAKEKSNGPGNSRNNKRKHTDHVTSKEFYDTNGGISRKAGYGIN